MKVQMCSRIDASYSLSGKFDVRNKSIEYKSKNINIKSAFPK